jgi:hypothetical protein
MPTLRGESGMVEVALLDTVRLEPPRPGYWGPGKAALWALLLGASLLAWAWDARWEERWEAWQLARRIKQRREGKRSFSAIENLDDILSLLLSRGVADAAARAKNTTDQQLGWQPLPNSPPWAAGTHGPRRWAAAALGRWPAQPWGRARWRHHRHQC